MRELLITVKIFFKTFLNHPVYYIIIKWKVPKTCGSNKVVGGQYSENGPSDLDIVGFS